MWYRTLVIVGAVLLAAGCGEAAPTAAPTAAQPAPATAAPEEAATTDAPTASGEATVAVGSSSRGEFLEDGEGRTLYLFLPDEQGESTCYDECAQTWPPLVGPAAAGEGADASLLATAEREDGTVQVTYNGWPLYYYAPDTAPGDVNGQGVGDVWYVVDAQGEPIKTLKEESGRGLDY